MNTPDWLETLLFFALATLKFAVAVPFYILQSKLSFWEALIFSISSGIFGILIFTFLGRQILKLWKWIKVSSGLMKFQPQKRVFTKKNRKIVRLKSRYGLIGIAILSPVILSLPLGCFLAVRYYKNRRKVFLYMSGGVILWSIIFSAFASSIVQILNSLAVA